MRRRKFWREDIDFDLGFCKFEIRFRYLSAKLGMCIWDLGIS